jgi:hypothetical protein
LPIIPPPPLTFWQGLQYCHDPRLVRYHMQQVRQAESLVTALGQQDHESVRAVMLELWADDRFLPQFLERYREVIGREPRGSDFMYLTRIEAAFPFRIVTEEAGGLYFHGPIHYALIRLLQPDIVVETGGTPGNSSAFILCALERNQRGVLHTIDLPPSGIVGDYVGHGGWLHEGMPPGQTSGWAVPDYLKERHVQHLGDARTLLPQVLDSLETIDVFLHDSDHSYEHMAWEFKTAWPYLRPGGLMLSDDIDTNPAWKEFITQQAVPAYHTGGIGATRKPT